MVDIYLFGKKYSVPDDLTIMRAMEYAGYQLVRGCGCRNGFCVLRQALEKSEINRDAPQSSSGHVRSFHAAPPEK